MFGKKKVAVFRSAGEQVSLKLPASWKSEPRDNGVTIFPMDRAGALYMDVVTFGAPDGKIYEPEPNAERLRNGGWFWESVKVEDEDGVPVHFNQWKVAFAFPGLVIMVFISWAIEQEVFDSKTSQDDLRLVRNAVRSLELHG